MAKIVLQIKGIVFLQETHSCSRDEQKWKQEWKGEIIFEHGEYNARGVAILIPEYLVQDIIFNSEILLVNLYCPTKDKVQAQNTLYEEIRQILENYGEIKHFLIGRGLKYIP